jgi:hypothetical protein
MTHAMVKMWFMVQMVATLSLTTTRPNSVEANKVEPCFLAFDIQNVFSK